MSISSIISLVSTTLVIKLLCKHKKIRALITNLVLQQVKEVGTTSRETNSDCTTPSLHRNNFNNTESNNSHILTLQKVKILQRLQVFKCGKSYDIYLRCTKLCTYQTM